MESLASSVGLLFLIPFALVLLLIPYYLFERKKYTPIKKDFVKQKSLLPIIILTIITFTMILLMML